MIMHTVLLFTLFNVLSFSSMKRLESGSRVPLIKGLFCLNLRPLTLLR